MFQMELYTHFSKYRVKKLLKRFKKCKCVFAFIVIDTFIALYV